MWWASQVVNETTMTEIEASISILSWWRGCHGASNHRQLDCLFKKIFVVQVKKSSKLCIIGFCASCEQESPHNGPWRHGMTYRAITVSTSGKKVPWQTFSLWQMCDISQKIYHTGVYNHVPYKSRTCIYYWKTTGLHNYRVISSTSSMY